MELVEEEAAAALVILLVDIPIAEVMVVMVSSSSHIQPNLNSKKSYIRCPRLN